jgi:hypothetical protein
MIGATPAGNLTVRLYQIAAEDTALNGTLLASSVSTAQAGTSQRSQLVLFQSSVVIQPGRYYIAWEADNTTLNFMRMSNVYGPVDGCYQFIDQTYGALPSTITSLTSTANPNSVPAVWLKMT